MDTFYITPEEFWERFNNESTEIQNLHSNKRARTTDTKSEARDTPPYVDSRYIIMYGRHRPGKKNKTWEADGYLSLIGQTAYVSDLRGRLMEEPTILDDMDYKTVEDLGEILIGKTEIQIIELDKKK